MISDFTRFTGRRLIDLLAAGAKHLNAPGLASSSPALAAALVAARLSRSVLIVTPDENEARKIKDELDFFITALDAPGDAFLLTEREPYRALPDDRPGLRAAALAGLLAATPEHPALAAASLSAVLARTPTPDDFHDGLFELRTGSALDRDAFLAALVRSGYTAVSAVIEPGDFSVRGGIIDVFLPGKDEPIRIELWGEEIGSLRTFDPGTQKSIAAFDHALAPPLKEVIVTRERAADAVSYLGRVMMDIKAGKRPGVDASDLMRSYGEIKGRIEREDHFPQIESYLPAFHPGPACALDFLPPDAVVMRLDPFLASQARERLRERLADEFERETARDLFVLAPDEHFIGPAAAEELLSRMATVIVGLSAAEHASDSDADTDALVPAVAGDLVNLRLNPDLDEPLEPLIQALAGFNAAGVRTVFVSPLPAKAERLAELLSAHGITAPVVPAASALLGDSGAVITAGTLQRGFQDVTGKLAVIPEAEIFGEKIRPRRKPRSLLASLTELADLSEGDYVVHEEHGIGVYRGLTSLAVQWVGEWDFIALRERPRIRMDAAKVEYAEGSCLFVPVHRVNQISKYTGPNEGAPALDTLGGSAWERYKKKVAQSVREFAEQLLKLYAMRQSHRGASYPPPDKHFREFEESFAYEETDDQLRAIEDVLDDLARERPMDRVVCGDVGYGKTEVALRAAFLAAMAGRQVAVLVPTTILAQQHYETFAERLKKYPLQVRTLSRFRSPKEIKEVIAGIKAGTVDIVIGTHRLLSKDVVFHDLGLLVIDEEHRFGVRHKERLRQLKATVDTLTLTATPIPRTLYMAMSGLRDLSIIDTPPADRQAVHTELIRADEGLIQEAILRELRRGGQVFYVHNRVHTIEAAADRLRRLLPQARVAVAHGQMDEGQLEKTMHEFITRQYDVLVCSAIIESGLDIPTVNTMIIDHSDRFGLAQLYQLRGRIGRSKVRGYCYLVVPSKGVLTKDAAHRLRVIKEFTELGSGFRVAAHDLEIRGAGNLLGAEQSGHIYRVGLELYMRLLEEEIQRQKGEQVVVEIEPEIKLPVSAYLPDEYVPDQKQRLAWYKRLARSRGGQEVDMLGEELADRYGTLPEPALDLLEISRIKAELYRLRATELAYTGTEITLALADDAPVDVDKIMELARDVNNYRIAPGNRIFRRFAAKKPADLFPAIRALLNELGPGDKMTR